ncbi:MAG: hypothetical protein EP338_05815 [Bacteroidetes bacterium]|nr:MAG: hypothetical protein EP338_05815 [Bacteroidota bacterium]
MKTNTGRLWLVCACFLGACSYLGRAQTQSIFKKVDYGIQLGTLGPGIVTKYDFNNRHAVRFSGSFAQISLRKKYNLGDVYTDRTRTLRTGGIGLVYDWKPLEQLEDLKLSGGIFYQFHRLNENRNYELDNRGNRENLGSLQIDVRTFPVNPYLGAILGKIDPERRWNLILECGVLFHARPQVDFTGTGLVAPTAEQDEIIEGNLRNYNFYPNLNIQLYYNLNYKNNEN